MNLTKEQIFGLYNKSDYVLNGKKYPYQERQGIIEDCLIITTIMGEPEQVKISDCKLILRPFEDIKEVEGLTFCRIRTPEEKEVSIGYCKAIGKFESYTFEEVAYLISISIDVFGAIEKGWAVREREVKK